jgi:hypothetical protein
MNTFAPEFAQFWLSGQSGNTGETEGERGGSDTPLQQAALEELAERVNAARSVV